MAKKKGSAAGRAAGKPARRAAKAPKRRPARKAAPKALDHDAMMAAWQKAKTPGPGHRRLEPLVGSWRATMTFVPAPGAPPTVSDGTSENRWVLGGRYLEQRFSGTSMGMPFEGMGYTGYDNVRGRYVGTWMDSFGTGMMHSLGVGKPTDNELVSESEAFEPSGQRVTFLCKLRVQDHDHHDFEMWAKAPNGRRFLTMSVAYARM